MKLTNINTADYSSKIAVLLSEVDYVNFQEQATALINQYHDEDTSAMADFAST